MVNFVVFKLIGYRKKILWDNVSQAYPEYTTEQQRQIIKDFQRGFCDHWLETLKLLTLSEAQLKERITGNWEVLNAFSAQHRVVHVLLAHRFNWEWFNSAIHLNAAVQFAGLYLPVTNKTVDRLILKIRTRMGSHMVPASNMRPHMKQLANQSYILGFVGDQNPANLNIATWYQFLNRPAPFLTGPEKSAKISGAAVMYASILQVKRGHYKVHLTPICEQAKATTPNEITDAYVALLQQEMKLQPHNWLWTHRRWKHNPLPETIIKHV